MLKKNAPPRVEARPDSEQRDEYELKTMLKTGGRQTRKGIRQSGS